MTKKKEILAVIIFLVLALTVTSISPVIQGRERTTYEVRPEITIPEHRTDAARAIDAYERLMERHMDFTAMQITQLTNDSKANSQKLDSINQNLTELNFRIERIEKALGLTPQSKPNDPNDPQPTQKP